MLRAETIARITPPITRLQAGVRGRIARNKYRKLLRQAAFRQHAAAEILQTEQSYAKQMILLNNVRIESSLRASSLRHWRALPFGA